MLRFLSYVVGAPGEVFIEEHLLALDRGTNVFSVLVQDPEVFQQRLLAEGCVIHKVLVLDEHEPVEPLPEVLEARVQATRYLSGK